MNIKVFSRESKMKLYFLKNEGLNVTYFRTMKFSRSKEFSFFENRLVFNHKSFKHLLSILYYYILVNKKVMLVGEAASSKKILFKSLKKSTYSFFPLELLMPGFFSNVFVVKTMLQVKPLVKKTKVYQLNKKRFPDLAIFVTTKSKEFFKKANYKSQIPSIFFNVSDTRSLHTFFLFFKSLLKRVYLI